MASVLTTLIDAVASLASPAVCRVCGCSLTTAETVMCLGCYRQLPRTYVHRQDFNDIHRRLGHHCQVDRAAGWFYYKKGAPYAQMLVDAKYGGMPQIDAYLARCCAAELAADSFFEGMDVVVPMPMYWSKRLLRGYNQAEVIARAIAEATGMSCVKAVRAVRSHGVQSRHNRHQRHSFMASTMDLACGAAITGRSVLLVDDIITSGASCIEAIRVLTTASPSSINVLSLGLTTQY